MTKRQKQWSIVLGLVVLAALSPFILWLFRYVSARATLNAKKDDLRKAGYALTLADVWPAAVPEHDNAAPLYLEAAKALKRTDKDLSELESQAFFFENPEGLKEVTQWLEENSKVLELVPSARGRPRCRYDRDFLTRRDRGYDEYRPLLDVMEFLNLNVKRWCFLGNIERAAEAIDDALGLAASFRDEPVPQSQGLYCHATTMVLEAMRSCIGRRSAAVIEMMRDHVPNPESVRGCAVRGLRGELAWACEIISGPAELFWALEPAQAQWLGRWGRFKMIPTIARDGAAHLDLLRRTIEACARPWPEARDILLAMPEEYQSASFDERPVTQTLDQNYFFSLRNELTMIAKLAVTRAGLDCELAWVRDGDYPDAVSGTDPFSLKPLIYDRDRRIITCVGPEHGEGFRVPAGGGHAMDAYGNGAYSWFLHHSVRK